MECLYKNLSSIEKWFAEAPVPSTLKDDNDFMNIIVETMSRALYLLRVGVSLAPNEEKTERGFTKHHAIIVGHMIRLTKLYDGFCLHVSKRQLEHAGIFMRLIHETEIRINYFIKGNKRKALKSYILTSYRSERQSLIDLEEKAKKRPLLPIEKRIKNSIMTCLRKDHISFKKLRAVKNWKIDGKDTREMLRSLGREWQYSYAFGGASRWIHGGWLELSKYHLKRKGRYYLPRLEYGNPDPRIAGPMTFMCLETLIRFLKWSMADPDKYLENITLKMMRYLQSIDEEHEKRLNKK
ncbi:DUF5677 domain-containing protein [Planctomycetota bacterium]